MSKKTLIKNTWNTFGKIGVKYADDIKKILEPHWYFAIQRKDRKKSRDVLRGIANLRVEEDPKFPDFLKIYCSLNLYERSAIVLSLEDAGIETYEGDLLNDRRFYIDSEIEIATKYKKLYFDIETDDTLPVIEIGRDRILSFAAIDSDGKIFFEDLKTFTNKDERILMLKILEIIKDYDIIMGWNSSLFDVPYLKMRMIKYGLDKTDKYCWKEVGHFDLLKRFRHIFRFDSQIKPFSLENIAQHFLKEGKIGRTEKTIDLWKNNKNKLKKYNIQDSVLVKKLDEELGVSDMMIRQSSWCGIPVGQFGLYSIIDAYIMRCAHRLGKFVKTSVITIKERSSYNERGNVNPDEVSSKHAQYLGAIVLDPIIGKYDNVYSFDFKGLYPSLMRTSNIGYDTIKNVKMDDCIVNPGTINIQRLSKKIIPTYFNREPSVINVAISELITKRSEYKKLKLKMIEEGKDKGVKWERVVSDEIIVKELANSTYGIMGLKYGRYFSVDVAESITLFGQWCINFTKKFFETEYCIPVIYGDTDSVFVVAKQKFNYKDALERFHKELWKELQKYNIKQSFIILEFDKLYQRLILVTKKSYAGHVSNIEGKETNQIYIRGLDCIKKSTFIFASEKQKELINKILYDNYDFSQIEKWTENVKNEFYLKDFKIKDLILVNKIGKPLDEYKSRSQLHVRLAYEIYKKTGEFQVNKEVEYIVTGRIGTRLTGVVKDEYGGTFDKEYYWNNKTVPVIERITKVLFPQHDFFTSQLKLEL